jgi:hypothetical protein
MQIHSALKVRVPIKIPFSSKHKINLKRLESCLHYTTEEIIRKQSLESLNPRILPAVFVAGQPPSPNLLGEEPS